MGTNEIEVPVTVTGIKYAVHKLGGQRILADRLHVKQQAVSLWVKQGYCPERHVDHISKLTGVPTSRLMRPETVRRALDRVAA